MTKNGLENILNFIKLIIQIVENLSSSIINLYNEKSKLGVNNPYNHRST